MMEKVETEEGVKEVAGRLLYECEMIDKDD